MKLNKSGKLILIIGIILSSIIIDQVSKIVVRENVENNSRTELLDKYLVLTKIENTGAFLGLGDSLPIFWYYIVMILIPSSVILFGLYYIIKNSGISILQIISISLILAGGVGNIIDRIIYNSVTDFLFFDFVIFHTGIVNMADIFVTFGFFILLFDVFIFNRKKEIQTDK